MLPDQSLQVREFAPIVEKQPINVHYQKYTADSFSSSSVSWNVDAPFAGALLDNELIIEYTLTVSDVTLGGPNLNDGDAVRGCWDGSILEPGDDFDDAAEDHAGLGNDSADNAIGLPAFNNRVALCEGFTVAACMQSCNVTINGQTLTQSPRKWMGEFMRFYSSPFEEKSICSLSGGVMDSGDHTFRVADDQFTDHETVRYGTDASPHMVSYMNGFSRGRRISAAGEQSMNIFGQIPDGREFHNPGFTQRFHEMSRRARIDTASADGAKGADQEGQPIGQANQFRYARSPTFRVYERLPMSPFLLWEAKDGRHSIPYVDKMEIDLRFVSDAEKANVGLMGVIQEARVDIQRSGGGPFGLSFTSSGVAPVLHLKWYIPPMGMVMQPQVSIPVQKVKEYSQSITSTNLIITPEAFSSPEVDFLSSNIRLQQVPDLFFIYAKPSLSDTQQFDPLEKHLEITELRITINGDSGKVLQASSARLYSLYIKNSPMARERNFDYDKWQKKYCTVVLTPADLGVLMPPGINHGVTLDVEGKVKSHWKSPAIRRVEALEMEPNGEEGQTKGRQYELHILSVYDKYELTLTNRGNAQLKLLNVPSPAVAQGVAQADQADLAQAFA